jgi:EH domain-containing protein 1
LILLLFDCSKLDISDEFKSVIEELQPYEDRVHCVLNKADQLDQVSLMRVYGALLWSMGRIFKGMYVCMYVCMFLPYLPSFSLSPLNFICIYSWKIISKHS